MVVPPPSSAGAPRVQPALTGSPNGAIHRSEGKDLDGGKVLQHLPAVGDKDWTGRMGNRTGLGGCQPLFVLVLSRFTARCGRLKRFG